MTKCIAVTKAGNPCVNPALPDEEYCLMHSQSEYAIAKRSVGRRLGGSRGKDKGTDNNNGHKLVTFINGDRKQTNCANCRQTVFDSPCPRPNAFPDQPYELEIVIKHINPYREGWEPIDWKQLGKEVEAKQEKEVATMTERVEERGPSRIDQLVSSLDVEGIMQVDGWWRSEDYRYNPEHEPIYALYRRREDREGLAPIPPGTIDNWPPQSTKTRMRAIDGMKQAILDKIAEREADPAFKAMEKELDEYIEGGGEMPKMNYGQT